MVYENIKLNFDNPIINNHKVYSQCLMPGLAYIDLIFQVFTKNNYNFKDIAIYNLTIFKPLIVKKDTILSLEIACNELEYGKWKIEIKECLKSNFNLYATATVILDNSVVYEETIDIEKIKQQAEGEVNLADVYEEYRKEQLVHTGLMKSEGTIYLNEETISYIKINPKEMKNSKSFMFHPAIIDGSCIAVKVLYDSVMKNEKGLFLPLCYEKFRATDLLQVECYAKIRKGSLHYKNELISWSVDYFNREGKKIAELINFTGKLVRKPELITSSFNKEKNDKIETSLISDDKIENTVPTQTELEHYLKKLISNHLGLAINQISSNSGYYEMGLDSARLLDIVVSLSERFNFNISPTLLFEYTTIADLAEYLGRKFCLEKYENNVSGSLDSEKTFKSNECKETDIAIIGMSGRYPDANNISEFWDNLINSRDSIKQIPEDRWDADKYKEVKSPRGRSQSEWGGFLQNSKEFDNKFFKVSPREAETMDPQERLFLEVSWEAIEDAGYTPNNLTHSNSRKVGVFVGTMHKDYALMGANEMIKGNFFPLSLSNGTIANRVSYYCDFHGPSMAIDTLCSSSLTAVHLAINSLLSGECEVAIAGGANLALHPGKYMTYTMWGMYSSDGRCKTFGENGDGYVSSEGIAAVLIKPLKQAEEDGDHIYAVIKGSSVNHVGKSSGIMVPSPTAQGAVISDCLEKININPNTISYVEAHGTGTALGDPIEIEGLCNAYCNKTKESQFCSIGSVKSNIGHTEAASGIIGLQKLALQLIHKQLVPSLHSEELNHFIDFSQTPFHVQHKLEEWKPITVEGNLIPRRAGISAFGATGSNAHMILEEYCESDIITSHFNQEETRNIIVISAKSEEQLYIYVNNIKDYLKRRANQKVDAGTDEYISFVIKELLAQILFIDESTIDADDTWKELGVEEILLIQLKDKIEKEFGIYNLDVNDLLEYNTVKKFSSYLLQEQLLDLSKIQVSLSDKTDTNTFEHLADVAYTLQTGRVELEERVAFIVKSTDELIYKMELFCEKKIIPPECYRNKAKQGDLFEWNGDYKDLVQIAGAWVKGGRVEWLSLCVHSYMPKRISLPTYPFNHINFEFPKNKKDEREKYKSEKIHPLLHKNISDIWGQKYKTVFWGNEFFLEDHVVSKRHILPGVVYLEMINAGLRDATGSSYINKKVSIKDVVWIRPIISAGKIEIQTEFQRNKEDYLFEIYEVSKKGGKTLYCRGTACLSDCISSHISIEDKINALKSTVILSEDFYNIFDSIGISYGATHRGVQRVYMGNGEALAEINLPDKVTETLDQFCIHPSIVDSAFQSTIVSLLLHGHMEINSPVMPFALQQIDIIDNCTEKMWAYITYDRVMSESTIKYDIYLYNESGYLCIKAIGFSVRKMDNSTQVGIDVSTEEKVAERNIMVLPQWNKEKVSTISGDCRKTIVICDKSRIEHQFKDIENTFFVDVEAICCDEDIDGLLVQYKGIERIVWISSEKFSTVFENDDNMISQEKDIVFCFRLIKKLIGEGYNSKKLEWIVITFGTQKICKDDYINSNKAGLAGLIGSMAKEQLNWKVKVIDIDREDNLPITDIYSIPSDHRGHLWGYRKNEWYQQQLVEIKKIEKGISKFKKNGVYIVIGGAGGVGEIWSEYMVKTYNAQIIWIGRRISNPVIEEKIKRISQYGTAPIYISADASNEKELYWAYREIKQKYQSINGIIHSAMVLSNKPIKDISEGVFRNGLSSKIKVALNISEVFKNEQLDFMLFFSSLISFIKNPKQSAYASGCTFIDSFANELARMHKYPVKIINWGYWKSKEAMESEDIQELKKIGLGLIEPKEGMEMLEKFLSNDIQQIALIKASKTFPIEGMNPNIAVQIYPSEFEKITTLLASGQNMLDISKQYNNSSQDKTILYRLILKLILNQLIDIGIIKYKKSFLEINLSEEILSNTHKKWILECMRQLEEHNLIRKEFNNYITEEGFISNIDTIKDEWKECKEKWMLNPFFSSWIILSDAMLQELPGIIRGDKLPTDIMFSNSSMNLVENIYKNNPVADFFNEVLAESMINYIHNRIKNNPDTKIKILEIGAGTGGTSSILFKKLNPIQKYIEEYCYSDISKSFLLYAEENYGKDVPYLSYQIINVEDQIKETDPNCNRFDIVVAANVLHATKNIRNTLRNAKVTMKKNGIILLNELSENSLLTHITFGLLDGWWLYDDENVRIKGCPGLHPHSWGNALYNEGYNSITFPAKEAHTLGQQIIFGYSDGKVQCKADITTKIEKDKQIGSLVSKKNNNVTHKKDTLNCFVKNAIIEKLAEALKVDKNTIDYDESFADYGLDSIIGVQLVQVLKDFLNIELETTSLFDYSSVNQLTNYIISNNKNMIVTNQKHNIIEEDREEEPTESVALSGNVANTSDKEIPIHSKSSIAIIGMSGRFGKSDNLEMFWEHLINGDEVIEKSPRWDMSSLYPSDTQYCDVGGFIDNIDEFDPMFFNISATEAKYMDPQQRLFLMEAWKAMEDAGYVGYRMGEGNCGVYVGCLGGESDYHTLSNNSRPPQAFWGAASSIVPARLSYYLDLKGPAIAIDTACSSSMVAIHSACQALWLEEINVGIAGGVFVQSTPWFYQNANKAGMLSLSGHSYVFDERADGFVPGEGVGVLILKRLSDAERDGDHIYGIIKGSAINQDGTTNGITAPSAVSQEKLECLVYENFNINPNDIQLVEAHGTGTKLGDPIEFQALTKSFRKYTDRSEYCAIGSVKTNIGHTAHAAGVASIIKVLLSMHHKKIVPSLNFEKGNSNIKFNNSPFYVNTTVRNWETQSGKNLCAAVSSFGFSGTNAHMVLEEAPSKKHNHFMKPGYIIALSARTLQQLKDQAEKLLLYIKTIEQISIEDMSYTLLLGRKHFKYRTVFIESKLEGLMVQLHHWLSDTNFKDKDQYICNEQTYLNEIGNTCIKTCISDVSDEVYLKNLRTVAKLHKQGATLELNKLFQDSECTIVSLPTYSFSNQKYWIDDNPEYTSKQQNKCKLLLQNNKSDFKGIKFESLISCDYLYGIRRYETGITELSGMLFLEMFVQAIDKATVNNEKKNVIYIEKIVWSSPSMKTMPDVKLGINIYQNLTDIMIYEVYFQALGNENRILNQGRGGWIEQIKDDSFSLLDTMSCLQKCYFDSFIEDKSKPYNISTIRGDEKQLLIELTEFNYSGYSGALDIILEIVVTSVEIVIKDKISKLPFALDEFYIINKKIAPHWIQVNIRDLEKYEIDINVFDKEKKQQLCIRGLIMV